MSFSGVADLDKVDRARATADVVFDRLRADILGGVHPPGTKLKFAPLSQRYQASVSVLREALTRLVEQRLVESEPRIGFRVVPLSAGDLEDLTWTRTELESLALRRAMSRGEVTWESTVLAAHHKLDRTPMLTDDQPRRITDNWEQAHQSFHRAVVSGCGSAWLISITDTLRDCSELYRRWSAAREPQRDVAAEHQAILDAVINREIDAAVDALTTHYRRTLAIVIAGLEP